MKIVLYSPAGALARRMGKNMANATTFTSDSPLMQQTHDIFRPYTQRVLLNLRGSFGHAVNRMGDAAMVAHVARTVLHKMVPHGSDSLAGRLLGLRDGQLATACPLAP